VRTLSLILLAGCWTGAADPPAAPVARTPANAEIRAIRKCSPTGPQLLILRFPHPENPDNDFEIEVSYSPKDPIPRVVVDGDRAMFSPCRLHGGDPANLTLAELEIGKRASGRYAITAKAGMTYVGDFEARWVGIPWTVDCPLDPV
jgi:hypothetical protein